MGLLKVSFFVIECFLRMTSTRTVAFLLSSLLVLTVFSISIFPVLGQTSVEERKERLEKELKDVENQIEEQQAILRVKRSERVSVERDLAILNAEIASALLEIKRKNIEIERLQKGINNKTETIGVLDSTLEERKDHVAGLVRQMNRIDNFSLPEMVLSNQNLSDFFEEVDEFSAIKTSLYNTFENIRDTKQKTHEEREVLGVQQDAVIDARLEIEAQKRIVEQKQAEKEVLLATKKNEERTYEQIVAEKQRRAVEIRAALFALRDTASIPFGEALQYAREAEKLTGVRPAFLLAILKQESNLGENVGTCNRPGDAQSWRDIMPGPNDNSWRDDQTNYLKITKALGLDPDSMPLSCPWQGGWGGAMGPSQFIPATWLQYADRVGNLVGVSMPNPWNPEHAFMASALYLADLGASNGGYTSERRAALQYYAGSNWSLPQNQFYGDGVMAKATDIQTTMIDPIDAAEN